MKEWQDILGINARNRRYLYYNTRRGRQIADSKLKTKKILSRYSLPCPELLTVFKNRDDIHQFAWENLPENFVLKPSSGYGGEGILVIRKKSRWAGEWELMNGEVVSVGDLRFHAQEILAGRFSIHNTPDVAFIEERIKIIKVFGKYTHQGTPDVRVIVFNRVPVMAMLRLSTAESQGKANLHQGAVGVGIDLATGVTTYGVRHNKPIKYVPGTRRKLNGLKIPYWDEILLAAVRTQEKISSLGFLGVDFVISKNRGPLILELNARPGLSIQICNRTGLKKRLERVERLEVRSAEHGVKIAKALFGASFADKVLVSGSPRVIGVYERVQVLDSDGKKVPILAKIDTGADRSSLDRELADELGLLKEDNIIFTRKYKSAIGKHQKRPVISLTFYLVGKKIETVAGVADRSGLRTKMLVGMRDMKDFVIKPDR